MTSRTARHEESYSSSNVVRSLNSNRPFSPPQKNIEFNNNNLDNLLDDLQTTVTRTAQHLDSANASKSRDVQFLRPSNSTTVVEERTSSPNAGRKVYKSRYEYSSSETKHSGGGKGPQPKSYESVEPTSTTVSQLDHLLDDLKQERDYSFDKDAGIDPGLLEPNTRVTKTSHSMTKTSSGGGGGIKPIKTFTYEIPNDTKVPTNKNFSYKNEYYNSMNKSNTYYPERDVPPPTTKHLRYTDESTTQTENIYPPSPQSQPRGPNKSYYYKKEINETKNTYGQPKPPSPLPVNNNNSTTIYESNVSNTRNVFHPPGGIPVYPANLPPHQPGTKQTYMYKKETTNTTNTVYEPPNGREYLPHDRYVTESPVEAAPLPPRDPVTNKYYKYSSTTTTTNTQRRPEREPLLAPFPTEPPTQVDGPPKHLNQLMESFNEETIRIEDEPYVPRKEVNTALASNKNIPVVEAKVPTKNIAGPPVYYPPNKELFTKSESQAAWRAGGGYGKGKGKYEYEAESKSKSASKSGAAVVPVCLPLCCAMPCTIM